jgi:hemerythrin-like domain-containing protein
MVETIELIDQLIAEHKYIGEKTQAIESAVNDAGLISGISEARDTFVPGRFDQNEKLKVLEEMLKSIEDWLEKHFDREENVLLRAVENLGDLELVQLLNKLLFEHSDLRYRLAHSRLRVAELLSGTLHRQIWNANANDTRTYLSHTRTLLVTHARMENELFRKIKRKIKEISK